MTSEPKNLHMSFLTRLPDEEPVVMVNLVRFRAKSLDGKGTGWDAYTRYSKGDIPLIKKVGGTVLWAGHVEGMAFGHLAEGRWDWVVLVQYPSRSAFLAMMTSEEYARVNVDRENGVEAHVVMAANQTYSKLSANRSAR